MSTCRILDQPSQKGKTPAHRWTNVENVGPALNRRLSANRFMTGVAATTRLFPCKVTRLYTIYGELVINYFYSGNNETQRWFDDGPASQTAAQHKTNICSISPACQARVGGFCVRKIAKLQIISF